MAQSEEVTKSEHSIAPIDLERVWRFAEAKVAAGVAGTISEAFAQSVAEFIELNEALRAGTLKCVVKRPSGEPNANLRLDWRIKQAAREGHVEAVRERIIARLLR